MQVSVDKPFEAWEEVQRHGLDLADKLAQGFNGMIQTHMSPPSFSWPEPPKLFDVEFPNHSFGIKDLGLASDNSAINGVSAILDIGNMLGQAGVDFGACLNGTVGQFFRNLPLPFQQEEYTVASLGTNPRGQSDDVSAAAQADKRSLAELFGNFGFMQNSTAADEIEEDISGFSLESLAPFARSKGTINITSTYDSRTDDVESSLVARGDLWRVEASRGSSTSGNENPSLFLVQLGPLLFFRDTKILLPVHLSKQHMLWYGYDRKDGIHSICPALWTKHRRWLLMSMICLNPLACSYVDLQFPNGQITYVSGEGITTSAFLPVCGGLLQVEGQYPGEMRFSFSCKNKHGTRITPVVQWPDKSFALSFEQALASKRSGLMIRPTLQFSLSPIFGGSNSGLWSELSYSLKEQLSLICGCAYTEHPSAFASISVGRSKWNGNVGKSGIVVRAEAPLSGVGRPAFSVQLNGGVEF